MGSCYDRGARNKEALQTLPTMAGRTMRKIPTFLVVAATVAAYSAPATADGARRAWRNSGYPVGAITRNVITPYYVGYYGSHYSYYSPGPFPNYMSVPGCWIFDSGYRVWVC
jgi:hypothetical protein